MNGKFVDNRIELYPAEVIAPRHVCDWCGELIAFRLFGQLVAGSYSQIGEEKVCPECVKKLDERRAKMRRCRGRGLRVPRHGRRRLVARRAGAR